MSKLIKMYELNVGRNRVLHRSLILDNGSNTTQFAQHSLFLM